MLLGHYYLTAPAMSIEPLKRVVSLIAVALAARCLLAGIAALAFASRLARLGTGADRGRLRFLRGGTMGHGLRGYRDLGIHDVENRTDPLDPVGDGDSLYNHDLRPVRRAHIADLGGRRRAIVLSEFALNHVA